MHLSDSQLNEYLDGALAPGMHDAAVRHLAACAECAARLTALKALFVEIESLPELELGRPLRQAVLRAVAPAARPALPRWLKWMVMLQTAIGVVGISLAAPLVSDLIPAVELPDFTAGWLQFQDQWTAWAELLLQIRLPAVPEIPISFEVSSLFLATTLIGLFMFWLLGNRLLLRKYQVRRAP